MNIKYQIKEWAQLIGVGVLIVGFLWICAATIVFRFRHPWATETESLLNIHHALMFDKLSYDEMRPRYIRGMN